jgi:glycerol-3-phosphate acyltransferase PlsY
MNFGGEWLTWTVLAVIGYLLGSIPWGLALTRMAGLGDIRNIGSGNIGATNVLRTGRRGLAAATVLLDAAKGALAVWIGWRAAMHGGMAVAGLFAVLGHLFPLWLGFKGGKGVATGLAVLIAASPAAGLATGAVWIATAWLLRMSSAAALAAFAAAPILVALLDGHASMVVLAAVVGGLVYQRHRGNIARLLAGTEPRIGQR